MRLGPTLVATLAAWATSFSFEQNLVRDPWHLPAQLGFDQGRNFSLRLARFAHVPASLPSAQEQCWICPWLRLVQQLGMQRMQQQWLSLQCLSLSAPLGCPHLQRQDCLTKTAR